MFLQVWIRPGGGLAEDYLAFLQSFTNDNTEATILLILGVFALFHSGLAGLRPQGAQFTANNSQPQHLPGSSVCAAEFWKLPAGWLAVGWRHIFKTV
jgi:hypothetical protein